MFPAPWCSQVRFVRADGKRPIRVDGSPASSTDPDSWGSWREVQSGAGDGCGVMLGGGLGCYDIDHCFDERGRLLPFAARVLAGISEPVVCAEVSVSGRGLHVFVEACEAPGRVVLVGSGRVEFYSRARFIRVTGNRWEV